MQNTFLTTRATQRPTRANAVHCRHVEAGERVRHDLFPSWTIARRHLVANGGLVRAAQAKQLFQHITATREHVRMGGDQLVSATQAKREVHRNSREVRRVTSRVHSQAVNLQVRTAHSFELSQVLGRAAGVDEHDVRLDRLQPPERRDFGNTVVTVNYRDGDFTSELPRLRRVSSLPRMFNGHSSAHRSPGAGEGIMHGRFSHTPNTAQHICSCFIGNLYAPRYIINEAKVTAIRSVFASQFFTTLNRRKVCAKSAVKIANQPFPAGASSHFGSNHKTHFNPFAQ